MGGVLGTEFQLLSMLKLHIHTLLEPLELKSLEFRAAHSQCIFKAEGSHNQLVLIHQQAMARTKQTSCEFRLKSYNIH